MDDQRTWALKSEKQNLLAARFEMRSQADKQKEEMMKAFENMQRKGKLDVSRNLNILMLLKYSLKNLESLVLTPMHSLKSLRRLMGVKETKKLTMCAT